MATIPLTRISNPNNISPERRVYVGPIRLTGGVERTNGDKGRVSFLDACNISGLVDKIWEITLLLDSRVASVSDVESKVDSISFANGLYQAETAGSANFWEMGSSGSVM